MGDVRGRRKWVDEGDGGPFKTLTRQEVDALRAKNPPVSPWRVIAVQGTIGVAVALCVWLFFGERALAWSALYGAATAVVPGALMARGVSRRVVAQSGIASAGASAVGVMFWAYIKIGVSVAMLMLAPKIVQPLSWPALLATLVLCMQVYWVALIWRGR